MPASNAAHAEYSKNAARFNRQRNIETALKTGKVWRKLDDGSKKKVEDTLEGFIAFKKTAQAGVESGKIDSIIHPILADHVLREALKFSDELKRVS
jgi:hypothetical protein